MHPKIDKKIKAQKNSNLKHNRQATDEWNSKLGCWKTQVPITRITRSPYTAKGIQHLHTLSTETHFLFPKSREEKLYKQCCSSHQTPKSSYNSSGPKHTVQDTVAVGYLQALQTKISLNKKNEIHRWKKSATLLIQCKIVKSSSVLSLSPADNEKNKRDIDKLTSSISSSTSKIWVQVVYIINTDMV